MSTMFSGAGTSPETFKTAYDIIGANKTEEDRLNKRALEVDALATAAGVDAKTLGFIQDQKRQATITNPNPLMTTGYTGVAGYGGRSMGQPYLLGT